MILDPVSKRKGLLMHTKMIAGIVKADKEAEEEPEERTRGFLCESPSQSIDQD